MFFDALSVFEYVRYTDDFFYTFILRIPPTRIKPILSVAITIRFDYLHTLKYLLGIPSIVATLDRDKPIIGRAANNGAHRIVKYILNGNHPTKVLRDPTQYACNEALEYASGSGYPEIVQCLLDDPRTEPFECEYSPLSSAATEDEVHIVDLLLKDGRADPNQYQSDALSVAAAGDSYLSAYRLLQDPRVNPNIDDNCPIRSAVANHHYYLVQLLLQDPRTDPTVNRNECLRTAIAQNYVYITQLLLQDDRVMRIINDNIDWTSVVQNTILNNNYYIVQLLLEVPHLQFDSTAWISLAVDLKQYHTVALLLQDDRCDPAENNNEAICRAAKSGSYHIVQLLLQHPRVDPFCRHNYPIKSAFDNYHYTTAHLLHSHWKTLHLM